MTSEQFTYWLQGFAELHATPPSPEQWLAIRDHLALVFEKRTPLVRQGAIPNTIPLPNYFTVDAGPIVPPGATVTC